MKAKELIEILQQNPELEIVVCECKKYEDDIPLIPVKKIELWGDEDSDNIIDYVVLQFDTKE